MPKRLIRYAVVGLGHIAQVAVLPAFGNARRNSKLVALVSGDPETQHVRTARDEVFNERRGWAWDKAAEDGSTPTYDGFTIEYVHFEGAGGVGSFSSLSVPTPVPEPPPTRRPLLWHRHALQP
jgi:hypothetical protein